MKAFEIKKTGTVLFGMLCLFMAAPSGIWAQTASGDSVWILPEDENSPAVWGIQDGIVFSLWPHGVEPKIDGPRGLIRIGHNFRGRTFMINFIAVEPVVDGEMEFSEISPSRVDGKVGKLMWAGDGDKDSGRYRPEAITRGTLTNPDPGRPEVEQLSLFIFMEKFLNGAHPYLKVTIRSDRPEEMGLEIFHHNGSSPMERCALTATMGNYSRVRHLYLKNRVIDSRELFRGYDDIHFVEEDGYPYDELLEDENGNFIAMAVSNETFSELSSWPQETRYYEKQWWRYRPFYKVTQYWRKDSSEYDPSLHLRVNGRAKYYSGGDTAPGDYVDIPGGVSFENFEMREDYYPGQKFYFGITRKAPQNMNVNFPESH